MSVIFQLLTSILKASIHSINSSKSDFVASHKNSRILLQNFIFSSQSVDISQGLSFSQLVYDLVEIYYEITPCIFSHFQLRIALQNPSFPSNCPSVKSIPSNFNSSGMYLRLLKNFWNIHSINTHAVVFSY